MLGDDFSMLDVAIAPLLWRLDYYGIDMSKNAVPLLKYAERIFSAGLHRGAHAVREGDAQVGARGRNRFDDDDADRPRDLQARRRGRI
jgi:glutathione S-transferase